jgi:ornithine decarboxylase
MDSVLSPLVLSHLNGPDRPIAIARPHRIEAAAAWFRAHFTGSMFYAVKANPAPWVLDTLWRAGVTAFDVASEVEAELIAVRFPRARLAFMHPVKSRRAIARAYSEFGVRTFALDCEAELDKILAETNGARDLNLIVRLPALGVGSAYPLGAKFGASASESPALLRRARAATEELMGVSFHVGSQCMRPDDFADAMADANRAIVQAGVMVDVVDAGGGFPAIYPGMNPPPMRLYMDAINNAFADMHVAGNAQLWIEPGRALVAEGAAVAARVELRKHDALYLNDGAFGSLFDATHAGWRFPTRLLRESSAEDAAFRFFGPTCDSLDAAAGPFMLPADVGEGDLIEIGQLGAYGQAMATRFNGFGETVTLAAKDSPWPSLFGPTEAVADIVPLPARKRRSKRHS